MKRELQYVAECTELDKVIRKFMRSFRSIEQLKNLLH